MLKDPKWDVAETKAKTETWRLDLLKAANFLEKGKWCQEYLELRCAMCLHGAINKVTTGSALQSVWSCDNPRWKKAHEAIGEYLSSQGVELAPHAYAGAIWNNHPDRTKDEVVAALRAAAAA